MISRRSFLLRAAGTAAAASMAVTSAIVMHRRQQPKPEPKTYYQVTCREISDNNVTAVWLGENKVWSETLREISWSTEDIDLVPDVGILSRSSGPDVSRLTNGLGRWGL